MTGLPLFETLFSTNGGGVCLFCSVLFVEMFLFISLIEV